MSGGGKEPVRLRRKTLKDGSVSLYLAIYRGGGRRDYEFLKLYLVPERTKADREANRNTLALANAVKAQRIVELQSGAYGFGHDAGRMVFADYFRTLIDERRRKSGKTASVWECCLVHIQRYERRRGLRLDEIDRRWVEGFVDYLERRVAREWSDGRRFESRPLTRNSVAAYYSKLRACLRQACNEGLIARNPAEGVAGPAPEDPDRAYLTLEELRRMAAIDCGDRETGRAFLFSCLTGLRRSDIGALRWRDVHEAGGRMRIVFRQRKTGGLEYLDLAPQAAALVGERGTHGDDERVFGPLLTVSNTNRWLQKWAQAAGIAKRVTFHTGRHTFATLMLTLGTDLYTTSKLLGHREIRTTQIYAKIIDKKKQEAIDNIPDILGNASLARSEGSNSASEPSEV